MASALSLHNPIAITMGEPAGIGGEIVLKAWRLLRNSGQPFFVVDNADRLASFASRMGDSVPLRAIRRPAEAAEAFPFGLPVLPIGLSAPVVAGRPDPRNADAVIASIERTVALAKAGEVAAVVTNPIQKSTLYEAGFPYPGHTEFLGVLAGSGTAPVMMLACPELRVVPVTVHMALREAINSLSTELIVEQSLVAFAALRRDFGIERPRLAVAGLNPHAGENGSLGDEDERVVRPAVTALLQKGMNVVGPLPSDTMFTPRARATYDVAICMYHDQALIPLKTIDMDGGVNVTLGLGIVRTSPDHGTALDIAGLGIARPESLIAAIRMAAEIAAKRDNNRGKTCE